VLERHTLDPLGRAELRQLQRQGGVLALELGRARVGVRDAVVQLEHVDVEEDDAGQQDADECDVRRPAQ
jgi:hypothetical protein